MPRRPPAHVAARQFAFAVEVRDRLYATKARPLGRKLRAEWARLLSRFTRTRGLRYGEVLAVAEGVAADLRNSGGPPPHGDTPHDFRLRMELRRRLIEATRAKFAREGDPWRGERSYVLTLARIRDLAIAAAVEDSRAGICFGCGGGLPCPECSARGKVCDRRGTLVEES